METYTRRNQQHGHDNNNDANINNAAGAAGEPQPQAVPQGGGAHVEIDLEEGADNAQQQAIHANNVPEGQGLPVVHVNVHDAPPADDHHNENNDEDANANAAGVEVEPREENENNAMNAAGEGEQQQLQVNAEVLNVAPLTLADLAVGDEFEVFDYDEWYHVVVKEIKETEVCCGYLLKRWRFNGINLEKEKSESYMLRRIGDNMV